MRTNERTNERTNVSATLPDVLANLRARRDALAAAVTALEAAIAIDGGMSMAPTSAPVTRERRMTSPGKRSRGANGAATLDDTTEAILTCLRQHGPQSPAELQKRAKISAYLLTSRLKQLGGRVIVTGTTADRMIALPGKTPAKEAP
jgi:hypothetical protein